MNSNRGLYYDLIEQGEIGLSEEDFSEHERRLAIAEGLINLYAVPLTNEPTKNERPGRSSKKLQLQAEQRKL